MGKHFQQIKESEGVFRGMLDHSRMALCVFMLSVVVVNPFGRILDQNAASGHTIPNAHNGRTILYHDSK